MKVKVKVKFSLDTFLLMHIYYKIEGKSFYSHIWSFPDKFLSEKLYDEIYYKGEFNIEMIKKEVEDYLRNEIKTKEETKIRNKKIKDFTKQEIKFDFNIEEE